MINSQPGARSGLSTDPGANGNGFHTGQHMTVDHSQAIADILNGAYGANTYHGVSDDMVLLNHQVNMGLFPLGLSRNEASWNVSKDTYTNSPFSMLQNDAVLQFKLHEFDSNGMEGFWLQINNDMVGIDILNADQGYGQGVTS